MAIIKTLDILLRGRTDQLGKDFKRAEGQFKSFTSRVKSTFAAVVPALSLAGFTASVSAAMNQLDQLGDRSMRLGIDPRELSALEQAAKMAGIEVNSLTTANTKLARAIDSANQGSAAAVKLFGRLGLSSEKLASQTTIDRLASIGAAFDRIKSPIERASLAVQIFGKSGLQILPLITEGANDLKNAVADLQRLGGAFSERDLAPVRAANDAWDRLTATFSYAWQAIAIQLSPSLADLFNDLTDAIKPGTALNGILRSMGDIAKVVVSVFQVFAAILRGLSEAFGTVTGRVIGYAVALTVIVRLTRQVITVVKALIAVEKVMLAIEAIRASLGKSRIETVAKTAAVIATFAGVALAVGKLEAQLGGAVGKAEKLGGAVQGIGEATKGIKEININPQSAQRGTQAAFEAVYGVKIQAPMDALIEVNKQGNGLLGDINEQIKRANGLNLNAGLVEGFE